LKNQRVLGKKSPELLNVEKAGKPRIGKPYQMQASRKTGEGAGKLGKKNGKIKKTNSGIGRKRNWKEG